MTDGAHAVVRVGPVPATLSELVRGLPQIDLDPVPHEAIANAHRIRATRRRLLESGAYDYRTLAQGRGASIEATRQFVSRAQRRHQLFTVEHDGSSWVPAFLLDEALDLRPEYVKILEPFAAAGSSGWAIWNWIVSPSGWLDGATPLDLMRTHPEAAASAARSQTSNSG